MGLKELQDVAFRGGMPRFVGRQLAEWIYSKGATDFGEMVNISKKNKEWLEANYVIELKEDSGKAIQMPLHIRPEYMMLN